MLLHSATPPAFQSIREASGQNPLVECSLCACLHTLCETQQLQSTPMLCPCKAMERMSQVAAADHAFEYHMQMQVLYERKRSWPVTRMNLQKGAVNSSQKQHHASVFARSASDVNTQVRAHTMHASVNAPDESARLPTVCISRSTSMPVVRMSSAALSGMPAGAACGACRQPCGASGKLASSSTSRHSSSQSSYMHACGSHTSCCQFFTALL